jgi:hypothetical protein
MKSEPDARRNVMISKLGGLSTFEALSCRVPIHRRRDHQPMPQEAGRPK